MFITSKDYFNRSWSGENITSDTGWVYCLVSTCGNYVKIGKTNHCRLIARLMNYNSSKCYASKMKLAWAIIDANFEGLFHKVLAKDRCGRKELFKVTPRTAKRRLKTAYPDAFEELWTKA